MLAHVQCASLWAFSFEPSFKLRRAPWTSGEEIYIQITETAEAAGTAALEVRDQMIPEVGIRFGTVILAADAKRAHLNGISTIMVLSLNNDVSALAGMKTVWIQQDGGPFQYLEPGIPLTVNGITFNAILANAPSGVGQGTVPAVSTWGLIVMAMLMLAAGTVVFARRRRQIAA